MAQSATASLMQRYPSPIPAMVQDGEQLYRMYRRIGIVPPYIEADALGFKFYQFSRNLAINSPSTAACINGKLDAAFGKPVLEKSEGMGFYRNRVILPDGTEGGALSQSFYDLGITPDVAIAVSRGAERNYQEVGNAYVRIKMAKIGDVTKTSYEVLDYTRVAYMEELVNGVPIFCISPVAFNLLYTTTYPAYPEFVAASTVDKFNWSRTARGTYETVLHIRNTTERSPWYGESPNIAASLYAFAEWQLGDYNNREAANDFMSRLILLMQDEAPTSFGQRTPYEVQQDMNRLQKRIADAMLKQSQNSAGVMVSVYPHGDNPPTPILLPPMTNEKYHETMKNVNSSYIYAVHNWSKVLTGFEPPSGSIGGNSFIDEFRVKAAGPVAAIQRRASRMWDGVLQAIADIGGKDLTNYGIGFESPFAAMIQQTDVQIKENAPAN